MNLLSWNCRGLGNPTAIRLLKKLIQLQDPTIVFLMETKLPTIEMARVRYSLGFLNGIEIGFQGDQGGRRGSLCLMWKDNIPLSLLSFSSHHVDMEVDAYAGRTKWRLTGIYGWSEDANKVLTWNLLNSLKEKSNLPWLCFGDFNEILYSHEKMGGTDRPLAKMQAFRDALTHCSLDDLGYKGYAFTWSNGRNGTQNIQKRLDRGVASFEWVNMFLSYSVEHIVRQGSNHCPLHISWHQTSLKKWNKRKLFRFESMWLRDSQCKEIVENSWFMSSIISPDTSISDRLSVCAKALKQWELSCNTLGLTPN